MYPARSFTDVTIRTRVVCHEAREPLPRINGGRRPANPARFERPGKCSVACRSARRGGAPGRHQRSTRGPIAAPAALGTSMPSRYQALQNGTPISGQCRQ